MKRVAIFYDKNDVDIFFKNPINVDYYLPFTPNAKSALIKLKKKNLINIIDYFNTEDHKDLIKITKKYQIKFNNALNEEVILKSTKKTLESLFNLSINSIFYIYKIINKLDYNFIYKFNKNIIETKSSEKITYYLFLKVINNSYGPFGENRNNNQLFPSLNNFILKCFFLFSNNRKKIIISGNNYGLKNLINLSKKKKYNFHYNW